MGDARTAVGSFLPGAGACFPLALAAALIATSIGCADKKRAEVVASPDAAAMGGGGGPGSSGAAGAGNEAATGTGVPSGVAGGTGTAGAAGNATSTSGAPGAGGPAGSGGISAGSGGADLGVGSGGYPGSGGYLAGSGGADFGTGSGGYTGGSGGYDQGSGGHDYGTGGQVGTGGRGYGSGGYGSGSGGYLGTGGHDYGTGGYVGSGGVGGYDDGSGGHVGSGGNAFASSLARPGGLFTANTATANLVLCPAAGGDSTPIGLDTLRATLTRRWLSCLYTFRGGEDGDALGTQGDGIEVKSDGRYWHLRRDGAGRLVGTTGVDSEGSVTITVNELGAAQTTFRSDLNQVLVASPVITAHPTVLIIRTANAEHRYIPADGP